MLLTPQAASLLLEFTTLASRPPSPHRRLKKQGMRPPCILGTASLCLLVADAYRPNPPLNAMRDP